VSFGIIAAGAGFYVRRRSSGQRKRYEPRYAEGPRARTWVGFHKVGGACQVD
jgi:hypothetical protein